MPTCVDPGSVAIYEHFGGAACVYGALTTLLDFEGVVRVQDGGLAIGLEFGLGELEANQLTTGGVELRGSIKGRLASAPGIRMRLDGHQLGGEDFGESGGFTGEPGAPDGLAGVEQFLALRT